ncbi:MAG: DUF167 domain-containing protein [Leptospiraceae bacterium]|nr:DUF167 domain-containing protein [Leptospiraceae bacterium]MCP5496513.1 DUF167 domain-containing protein [Leptospiraceae bacterium]
MKILVVVKPNSKKPGVDVLGDNSYLVRVNQPATEGKANKAVVDAISEHFHVSKSKVIILKGEKNKNKLIEIIGV